jgi:cell division protein FtsB
MTKQKVLKIIYIIGALIIISLLLINDNGVIKYFSLKKELIELDRNINSSKLQIEKLSAEIDSLKNIDAKIEQVARDKYRMKLIDEIPVRINKQ